MSFSPSAYSALIPSGEQLPEGPVVDFDPGAGIPVSKDMYSDECIGAIRDIDRGEYALLPDVIDPEMRMYGPTAVFNQLSDLERTRTDSMHGVMFGQLIMRTVMGDERAELVAVKPFDIPGDIAKELSVTRYFYSQPNTMSNFTTFEPLGVLRRSDGSFGMITKYDHSVRSLDNVFMNEQLSDENIVVLRAIGKCATILANMHAQGFAHGDAQAKNMFVSNHEQLFIADLESVRPFRPKGSGGVDDLDANRKIRGDLVTLAQSMTKVRPELLEGKESMAETTFGLVYSSIVNSPHSVVPEGARLDMGDLRKIIQDPYATT